MKTCSLLDAVIAIKTCDILHVYMGYSMEYMFHKFHFYMKTLSLLAIVMVIKWELWENMSSDSFI